MRRTITDAKAKELIEYLTDKANDKTLTEFAIFAHDLHEAYDLGVDDGEILLARDLLKMINEG